MDANGDELALDPKAGFPNAELPDPNALVPTVVSVAGALLAPNGDPWPPMLEAKFGLPNALEPVVFEPKAGAPKADPDPELAESPEDPNFGWPKAPPSPEFAVVDPKEGAPNAPPPKFCWPKPLAPNAPVCGLFVTAVVWAAVAPNGLFDDPNMVELAEP